MLVSGRNNVKEILRNFGEIDCVKTAYCQENYNENDVLSLLKMRNVPIKHLKKGEMDHLAKNNHQGIVLEVRDFAYSSLDDIIANKDECFVLILDHLEDPHNLGAIARTVEASQTDGIILPQNRSVSVNETVMKTSVGALYNVKIASVTNLVNTIKYLKKNGFWIIGTDMGGTSYTEMKYPKKTALIIGNEGVGMTRIVRDSCDYIVGIPMKGKVNSLNASVAAGILIYEIIRNK